MLPRSSCYLAVLGDVVRDFEVSEGAGALGVHHALGDPLPVEVRDLVDEGGVLEQQRAARADGQRVQLVVDGRAPRRRQRLGSLSTQNNRVVNIPIAGI